MLNLGTANGKYAVLRNLRILIIPRARARALATRDDACPLCWRTIDLPATAMVLKCATVGLTSIGTRHVLGAHFAHIKHAPNIPNFFLRLDTYNLDGARERASPVAFCQAASA